MILIQVDNHHTGIYDLGERHGFGSRRPDGFQNPLDWTPMRYVGLSFQDANKLKEIDRRGPYKAHYVEFGGHKLISALYVEKKILDKREDEDSLARLLANHQRLNETEAFKDQPMDLATFHKIGKLAAPSDALRTPSLFDFFLTYEGQVVYAQLRKSVPSVEAVSQDSIFSDRTIVSIEDLLLAEEAAERKRAEKTAELHQNIRTKGTFRNHEIVRQIADARLINHFRSR